MAPRYTAEELDSFEDFIKKKHGEGFDVDALETYKVLGPNAQASLAWSRGHDATAWFRRYKQLKLRLQLPARTHGASGASKPRRAKTPTRALSEHPAPRRPPPSAVRGSKPASMAAPARKVSFAAPPDTNQRRKTLVRGTSPERGEPAAPRRPQPSSAGRTKPPPKAVPPPTAKTLASALETSFNPARDIKKIARDSGVPQHRVSTLVHGEGVLKAQAAALWMRHEGHEAQERHIALTASATKKRGRGACTREGRSGGKDEPPIMFLRTSVSPVKRRNAEASSSKRTLDNDDRDVPTSKRRRMEDEVSYDDGGEKSDSEVDELEETDDQAPAVVYYKGAR